MNEQNYKNHKRLLAGYHFFTFSLILILLVLSVISFVSAVSGDDRIIVPIMFIIASVLFLSIFFYARMFALKAQDRAIRAEENFRHYILTGKVIDPKVSLSQILALRFAHDNEFIELAKRAMNENLSNDEIKRSITKWKGDYHRV